MRITNARIKKKKKKDVGLQKEKDRRSTIRLLFVLARQSCHVFWDVLLALINSVWSPVREGGQPGRQICSAVVLDGSVSCILCCVTWHGSAQACHSPSHCQAESGGWGFFLRQRGVLYVKQVIVKAPADGAEILNPSQPPLPAKPPPRNMRSHIK